MKSKLIAWQSLLFSYQVWAVLIASPFFRQKKGEALFSRLLLKDAILTAELLTTDYGSPVWCELAFSAMDLLTA